MSDNRDTQFKYFAECLFEEITNVHDGLFDYSDWWKEQVQNIIARRAYDLVEHAICHVAMQMGNDSAVMFVPRRDAGNCIPDMIELPKESNHE